MSWFQLDASTIAGRVHAEGEADQVPSLPGSFLRGMFGFAIAGGAAFVPWAMFGDWLVRHYGEGGLVGACAIVFVLLCGPLLHRLIIGPDSLLIFYKLFSLTFAVLALAWLLGWACLGGKLGSAVGLLAWAVVTAWMLGRAFEVSGAVWKVAPLLFLFTLLGYFGGGWIDYQLNVHGALGLPPDLRKTIVRLMWGLCFGAGLGAGLGLAFHLCQSDVREFLRLEAARGDDAAGKPAKHG
jgi:hypothetical protein